MLVASGSGKFVGVSGGGNGVGEVGGLGVSIGALVTVIAGAHAPALRIKTEKIMEEIKSLFIVNYGAVIIVSTTAPSNANMSALLVKLVNFLELAA